MPIIATRQSHHLNAVLSESAPVPKQKWDSLGIVPGPKVSDYTALPVGIAVKQEVLQAVAEKHNPFTQRALKAISELGAGYYTGERVRHYLEALNIRPQSANAWGSVISQAIKRKLLTETGKYEPMKDEGSHGRKTQVYYRLQGQGKK